jgi:hypothetical protein
MLFTLAVHHEVAPIKYLSPEIGEFGSFVLLIVFTEFCHSDEEPTVHILPKLQAQY